MYALISLINGRLNNHSGGQVSPKFQENKTSAYAMLPLGVGHLVGSSCIHRVLLIG